MTLVAQFGKMRNTQPEFWRDEVVETIMVALIYMKLRNSAMTNR
jgi:hypothetical protein